MLLLAVIGLGVPLAINLSARVTAEVRTQAQAQADLIAATAADLLPVRLRSQLQTLATTAAASVRGRVLIVDRHGAVLVDSAGPAQVGTSYESRPEIEAALRGRQIQVQRASRTLGQEILATAVPIVRNRRPVGAVRVTQSIAAVHAAIRRAELGVVLIGVIVVALGLLAGAVIAGQVARPIKRLEAVARHVAQGDLSAQAPVEGSAEQRSLASSFNEMTGRIAGLLAAQRQFVADASHQLRTPLTGLRLRLEEAKAQGISREAGSEIDAAIAEVDRLAHTVEELLALSSAGRRPAGTAVDLNDVAAVAAGRWRAAAHDAGLQLLARQHDHANLVWVARADAERALDSLVENAVAYSPSGTTVELISAPMRIEVRDRGPGVGEDEREDVFERFHRGRAGIAGSPGSGLGLAIARELARAWGGEVTLQGRGGGGCVAVLSLPAVPVGESGLPALNLVPTKLT